MKKKILFIVKGFGVNGVSSVIINLIKHINKDEFQIDLLTGSDFTSTNKDNVIENGGKFFSIPDRDLNIFIYIKKLCKIIREENYSIVHVHGNSSMVFPELVAAKFAGVKVRIAHCHNTSCEHRILNKVMFPLFQLLVTDCFACGKEAGEWMFGKNRKFTIIPNAVDTKKFEFSKQSRIKLRSELGVRNQFVIGHVGVFNQQKNQKFMIEVLKGLLEKKVNACMLFVGGGDLKKSVEDKALEFGVIDNTIFMGEIDNVSSVYSACDVLVLPSLYEGLPCVLVEAQVNGLSLVISKNVTKDVQFNDNVIFLDLNVDDWVNELYRQYMKSSSTNREEKTKDGIINIKESGYEIYSATEKMQDEYKYILEKRGKNDSSTF